MLGTSQVGMRVMMRPKIILHVKNQAGPAPTGNPVDTIPYRDSNGRVPNDVTLSEMII